MSSWRVYLRDADRVVIGALDVWSDLTLVMRDSKAGSFTMQVPGDHPQAALLTSGIGIVVYSPSVPDRPIFSGPIKTIERASVDGFSTAKLTISGVDDLARFAYRLAWPKPSAALTAQTDAADVRSDVAETVIRGLLNDNAGPAALVDRRISGLTVAADESRGATVEASARYDNLLELCSSLAAVGGISFSVQQDGTDLALLFREPQDKSLDVRFSSAMGNLTNWKYSVTAPSATRAIVGGLGEDAGREMLESAIPGPEEDWAERVELFVDARDIDDPDALAQRGDEELAVSGATAGLSITPVDIPAMEYGVDYFLGDTVSVEIDGVQITQPVSEITIKISDQGAVTTPTIGDPQVASDSTALYSRVRSIAKRVGLVERRK